MFELYTAGVDRSTSVMALPPDRPLKRKGRRSNPAAF